jgi:hypothetical protein
MASNVLLALLFSSFILHFLKLADSSYQDWWPQSIRTVTPENICAVSVLAFPWFFLSKKNLLRDYMFYMGVVSGLGATLFPVDVIGHGAFEFETIRFYFCHILIWVVPLLTVILKLHTLDYRRIVRVPLLAYLVLCIILVNEVILSGAGFVNANFLYNPDVRNASLIFGPNAQVAPLGSLFVPLTPSLFTTVPIGVNAGAAYHWPIIWLIVPSFVYLSAASLLLALPFEHKRIKSDILRIAKTLRGKQP